MCDCPRTVAPMKGCNSRAAAPVLLGPGAVTRFVPGPVHIQVTGVLPERPCAVSLHLDGCAMNSFNSCDVAAGTRRRIEGVQSIGGLIHEETPT